ncbi:MAG: protein kinase [Methylacidiphilales bacterium]|nr:protein kinase [Candidatus Methylacidiphilales bacterium]
MDSGQQLFSAGSRVGQYLILEKLGEGGMSEVFKAIEPTLERYVAIKIMHRTNMNTPEVMANFLEEARAIAGLRHTNIVPLYSAGEEQGVPYLAMGYIEGQTLEDWILAGRIFNMEEAMWFMRQAVAALEYAARSNIIHLDVKPANFMVDSENVVMLTDFGLARKQTEVASGVRNDELQGTPAYASPEHVLQEKPDLRTDMYCLGASLYHLITGEFPYPGESTEDVCRSHVFDPFPIETLQRHEIPPGWCSLIRKMMEKKPEDRFQNYAEITAALDNINHFQYGKKMLSVVETVERRALPRTEGSPESLFDLVPDEMATQGDHLFTLQDTYDAQEVYRTLDIRWPVLALNEMAPDLRAMQKDTSEDLRSLIEALLLVPSYKETLEVLSNFMANASDARPQSDAEKIELVGIERSRNIALTAIALYRPWQGECPLNWHGLWQHQIYTGLLAEFLVDMLGLPATGMEYVCGVVHDIGKLVLAELYPAKTIGVWMHAYEQNLPLSQVERQYFGIDHVQLGQEWLHRHKFQRAVRYVVAYHEEPENCYQALMESSKLNRLASMISTNRDDEINLLTHLIFCADTLARELGLGYSGNPLLDQTPWLEQPTTQLIFDSRGKEEVTIEEFGEFFTKTCVDLPDLPFTQLAHAAEAKQRRFEKAQKESKGKK